MSTQTRVQSQSTGPSDFKQLTHREILSVLSGLLLSMFVSNLAGTIVANALPTIAADLGSTQQQYTWIVTSTMLASTASTPIWGKLADLFDKKFLALLGLGIFTVGSLASGFAVDTLTLIGARAIQGIGLGAMMSLNQAIIGVVIPPLQRGRYMAYTGAAMAAATVAGPFVGGYIVDQPWLGWRWCFWSAVPLALLAGAVLQFKLRVPKLTSSTAKVDWLGATLVTAAVSLLLIWISFVDHNFAWNSSETYLMVGGAILLAVLFVIVELKVPDPIISMKILTQRTTALAVVASIAVGIAMFGTGVFMGQYLQLARGFTPTQAGAMTIPMMVGVLLSSVFVGRWVSRVGVWKPFVFVGSVILTIGFTLLATINNSTEFWMIAVFMVIAGLGVGMTMQNLVLAVQNTVSIRDVGSASATVTFFRSLGGAMGIQVLGSVFSHRVSSTLEGKLRTLHIDPSVMGSGQGGNSLDLKSMPEPVAQAVRTSYGSSIGTIFLIAAVSAVIAIIATSAMRGTRLRSTFNMGPSEDVVMEKDRDEAKDRTAPGEDDAAPIAPGAVAGDGESGHPGARG